MDNTHNLFLEAVSSYFQAFEFMMALDGVLISIDVYMVGTETYNDWA